MLSNDKVVLRNFIASDIEKCIYWETVNMAIYTQTWSGNTRMIALAGKLGFEECNRKVNFRTVRGTFYDGLTFRLNLKNLRLSVRNYSCEEKNKMATVTLKKYSASMLMSIKKSYLQKISQIQ